jgi:chemotaxis protein MotB
MKSGRWIVAMLLAGQVATGAGCVSLDAYRKMQMDNNKLIGEKTHLEQELYDARNNNDGLRTKLVSAEDQLQSKEMLVANLQTENERLAAAVGRADSLLQDIARKNMPTDPIVIERVLPAALDSAIKQFAEQYPNDVYYDPQRGVVKWKSDLLFALGSDVVKQNAIESLTGFAQIMKSSAAAGFEVIVVGHTDNVRIGKPETRNQHPTNWHLSTHRSISVGTVLQTHGLQSEKIGVMGFGEYRPIASNAAETGRSQNRRVEIYVVPEGSIAGVVMPPSNAVASQRVTPGPVTPAAAHDDGVK